MHRLLTRVLAILGALLLIVAVIYPWMSVPVGFATRSDGTLICTSREPNSAIPFRATCGAFAIAMGLVHLRSRRPSDRKAILAATALSLTLFFPCIVMTWEREYAARVSWLQIQHENLTWLGGDLVTSLEYSRKSWKDRVYLVDTPRQITVIRMPNSALAAFQIGRASAWLDTLGYSNRFCQFVNRGWFAALCGMALLALANCLPEGRLDRRRFARAGTTAMVVLGLGIVLVAVPVLVATRELERARGLLALGRLEEAGAHLRRAARIVPALREDTYFVAQTGLIDHRLGRTRSLVGRLFEANLLERRGRDPEAADAYMSVLDESPPGSAVRRETTRALLRFGTLALNEGRAERARTFLERVLAEEPCNLKANYALQLAYLRSGRRDEVARLVRRIQLEYAYFQAPTKEIVLAMSHENELFAALRDGDIDGAFASQIRTKRP